MIGGSSPQKDQRFVFKVKQLITWNLFRRLTEKFLTRNNNVFRTNSTTAREIIMLCKDLQSEKINATQFVIRLHEKSFLIYPGEHVKNVIVCVINHDQLVPCKIFVKTLHLMQY